MWKREYENKRGEENKEKQKRNIKKYAEKKKER